jgi:hypothetical protein
MKIIKAARHRNGVTGRSFAVVLFKHEHNPGTVMLGVMFSGNGDTIAPADNATAVFDLKLLKDDCIEFGQNSWRGDHYQDDIAPALARRWPWASCSVEAGIPIDTPDSIRVSVEQQAANMLLGAVSA